MSISAEYSLPTDLVVAQTQAIQSLQAAIAAGYSRIQVDILAPDLKPEQVVWPFLPSLDPPLQVFLPDAGAAALAQREWNALGGIPEGVSLQGLGTHSTVTPGSALLFALPNVVSVDIVERLCQEAVPGQVIILVNPQFQDAATVGIGLTGRRLRERFLSTFEPAYFLQSLPGGALYRAYPDPWTLWQQGDADEYTIAATFDRKPSSEDMAAATAAPKGQRSNPFAGIRQLIRSLNR